VQFQSGHISDSSIVITNFYVLFSRAVSEQLQTFNWITSEIECNFYFRLALVQFRCNLKPADFFISLRRNHCACE